MVKVAVIVSSHNKMGDWDRQTGWFLPEVAHPVKEFTAANIDIVFASPKGGDAEVDLGSIEMVKDDPDSMEFLEKQCKDKKTLATVKSDTLKAEDFDAIFFAGGHGTVYDFANCTAQVKLTEKIWKQGGVVAAICHGVAALENVKTEDNEPLVKGKNVCGFTTEEEDALGLTEVL